MKKWRDELKAMMDQAGHRRKPALRRSNRECFLLATDFPKTADDDTVKKFLDLADKAGWHTERENGWIFLDREPVFEAAETIPVSGPEAACCLSIMKRFSGKIIPSDGTDERALLKAAEEGNAAYESVCGRIHAAWAVSMRKHNGITGVDRRFFGGEDAR